MLFFVIGSKYAGHPVLTASADQITLGSPAAITDMRAIGALFFSCGLVTIFFLGTGRILAGLYFVLTVVGTVTLARIYGLFEDGSSPETLTKLKMELILLAIFTAGIILERIRRRKNWGGHHCKAREKSHSRLSPEGMKGSFSETSDNSQYKRVGI
jgi:hypothetical protein